MGYSVQNQDFLNINCTENNKEEAEIIRLFSFLF